MPKGYFILLLHAHLPYVRHPEYERFFEENWLFEAITDSYIPLIGTLERLVRQDLRFRLTVSLSPSLLTMLQDDLLQERYAGHMRRLIDLCGKEVERTRREPDFHRLALMYHARFTDALRVFVDEYGGDLTAAFRRLHASGALELITSAATHGYLPLLRVHPASVRAQLAVAAQTFERIIGHRAPGIWLPECGYYPGLETALDENGFRYFVVDAHGIDNAATRPRHGTFAPLLCRNGVAAFGRDPDSSRQVWSAEEGYPGDPDFREYYRDIGFDLDFDYVKSHILDGRTRVNTGVKYYRITGSDRDKQPYDPNRARARVATYVQDFTTRRLEQAARIASTMDRPPMILAPFDAELFGHWWYEGPLWLEGVLQALANGEESLQLVSPSDYLARHGDSQVATPSASSWGYRGYSEMWLNESNDWIYPHLHDAGRTLAESAKRYRDEPAGTPRARALNQAARSLLLAQASDWPFIMKTGTTVEYAQRRVRDQVARLHYLLSAVETDTIDETRLRALEYMDNVFPDVDFRMYAEG